MYFRGGQSASQDKRQAWMKFNLQAIPDSGTVNATGLVYYLDLETDRFVPLGVLPDPMGTPSRGNRMFCIITDEMREQGLESLYIMAHGSNTLFRTFIRR